MAFDIEAAIDAGDLVVDTAKLGCHNRASDAGRLCESGIYYGTWIYRFCDAAGGGRGPCGPWRTSRSQAREDFAPPKPVLETLVVRCPFCFGLYGKNGGCRYCVAGEIALEVLDRRS